VVRRTVRASPATKPAEFGQPSSNISSRDTIASGSYPAPMNDDEFLV
jgi:hypothetical protein